MTGDDATKLISQALSEPQFLEQLLADPKKTSASVGVQLSEDEVSTLQAMTVDEFKTFASEYQNATDPAKRRAAC
jgi:hypothetical protein